VHVASRGAASLRLRIATAGERSGLAAFDEAGDPVATVESVDVRSIDPAVLRAGLGARLPLYRLEWVGVEPAAAESPAEPEVLVAEVAADDPGDGEDAIARAHAVTRRVLQRLQDWLTDERSARGRLCIQTQGAVAIAEGEDVDLACAPAWGLVRSAQAEHPGMFALLDSDGSEASRQALAAALAAGAEEPQLALREGRLLTPRLTRVAGQGGGGSAAGIEPGSTVLITGGTGGLGARVARHLAAEHGARRLVLVSRRGPDADGAGELVAELAELGAEALVRACDVSSRSELRELLESVAAECPLATVVHAAGVVEDGLLESIEADSIDRVFAPKADAAWHLHELSAELELSPRLIFFSSAAGVLGSPGQGNYAAANAFLDGLAARRRAAGLDSLSLAWGAWDGSTGMTGKLDRSDMERAARFGIAPIRAGLGLDLFDAARQRDESLLVPLALDAVGLRAQASTGMLPPPLRGLVGAAPPAVTRESLAKRLAGVPEMEREQIALELVRSHVAAALGHASATGIEPQAAFADLGFDSLAAVELRNRLGAATGLRLPPTLVFDHPSSAAVAAYLLAEVAVELGEEERAEATEAAAPAPAEEDLASLSNEEMFELIDGELSER